MSVETKKTIKRNYGIERNFGNILKSNKTGAYILALNFGVFGKLSLTMRKAEKGTDLLKSYIDKSGNEQSVCIGKLFQATNKNGAIIEGIFKATLGMRSQYNKDTQKTNTMSDDAVFIVTHRLKAPEKTGNPDYEKVGYVTGRFGIEMVEGSVMEQQSHQDDLPEYDDDGDQIPF